MSMVFNKELDNDCRLGMWEIEEDLDTLLSKVYLTPDEEKSVEGFQSYQRKLEWVSVRVLVNSMLDKHLTIVYDQNRKPFLHDKSFNISISHSRNLTSILVSKNKKVGIDLEFMSHKITKIAHKFINDREIISDDPHLRNKHLYIHWCAKEALYKICDKQDINFKQNLCILPFDVTDTGNITGIVENKFGHEEFKMNYFFRNNYIVVWCNK